MKYETPKVTPLTSAINATQDTKTNVPTPIEGSSGRNEVGHAYEDWE